MGKIATAVLALSALSTAHAVTPISLYVGEWKQSGMYLPGQVVSYNNASWLCVKNCIRNTPGTTPGTWITLGSNGPGGGIKVYDANNQYLGYAVGGYYVPLSILDYEHPTGGPSVLLTGTNKLTLFNSGVISPDFSPIFDLSPLPPPDASRNGAPNYGRLAEYSSNNCSGPKAVYPISDSYLSMIGIYQGQPGFITKTNTFLASNIKSMSVYQSQCTPGQFYQDVPPIALSCSSSFPVVVSGSQFRLDVESCIWNSLRMPCYECTYAEIPAPQQDIEYAEYAFHPVTLPFTLPVALPLRYEVAK